MGVGSYREEADGVMATRVSRSDPVYRITGAQTGLSAEQRARTRRYLTSMAIRTVCFLGAIVAHGPLRWALVVGAALLPYIAVVGANVGRERDGGGLQTVLPEPRPSLGPSALMIGPGDPPAAGPDPDPQEPRPNDGNR